MFTNESGNLIFKSVMEVWYWMHVNTLQVCTQNFVTVGNIDSLPRGRGLRVGNVLDICLCQMEI